jgi:hypothetical protein
MKKMVYTYLILAFLVTIPGLSHAQFKRNVGQPNISGILNNNQNDLFLGLFDPSRMHMHHSFSLSYGGFGGNSMMLSSYINFMDYQISDNLFLQTNLGIMSAPYHTFGEKTDLNKPKIFGGARLEYKMSDHSSIMLQF